MNSFLRLLWGTPFPNWLRHDLSTGLFKKTKYHCCFLDLGKVSTQIKKRKWIQVKGNERKGHESESKWMEMKSMKIKCERKKATSKRWTTLSTTPLYHSLWGGRTLYLHKTAPYCWSVRNPVLNPLKVGCLLSRERSHISPTNFVLKMMFLVPR